MARLPASVKTPESARFETFTPPRTGDRFRLILVTFLWALCFPLISIGLSKAPPLFFAALRSLLAGLSLLIPAFVLRRPLPRGLRVWLSLLGVGLGYTTLGFAGMFLAGGMISPGLATVLFNSQPLIAAVLAYFVLRERLPWKRALGLPLAFAGIILIGLPSFTGTATKDGATGIAYVFIAAAGVAASNILLKRFAAQVDPLMAAGWQFILGSLPLLFAASRVEVPSAVDWNIEFITLLLVLSLVGTALAFVLWTSLLQRSSLNHLNIFTFLTPVFALVIGALFFNERLGWLEIGGIVLIGSGVVWLNWRAQVVQDA